MFIFSSYFAYKNFCHFYDFPLDFLFVGFYVFFFEIEIIFSTHKNQSFLNLFTVFETANEIIFLIRILSNFQGIKFPKRLTV